MDDFIDYGEGADGAAARRRRRRALMADMGYASEAMAEAARIFGDATDLHDLVASRRALAAAGGEGADYEDEDEDDGGADDDGEEGASGSGDGEDGGRGGSRAAARRARRAAAARERARQRLLEAADPEYVAAHYLSAADEAVRAADRPERLQLLLRPHLPALLAMDDARRDALLRDMAR